MMGAETGIEWAHSTVNVWLGCTKVSPACKHCYAETNSPVRVMEVRIGEAMGAEPSPDGKRRMKMWGTNGFRYETANWERELRRLNRKAKRDREMYPEGSPYRQVYPHQRPRVFINSLSDIFEDWQGPVYAVAGGKPVALAGSLDKLRAEFFRVAEECTELDILLVTKRPENVLQMVNVAWSGLRAWAQPVAPKWPSHIWIGTTVEDQEHADKRIPELLNVPAKVRFLSMEPLLGKVDLVKGCAFGCNTCEPGWRGWSGPYCGPSAPRGLCSVCNGHPERSRISWVIVGGESGINARPMHPDWVRSIRDQCVEAGVPFFFKQWGEWLAVTGGERAERLAAEIRLQAEKREAWVYLDGACSYKVGKKNAGRLLDGREWNEVPK